MAKLASFFRVHVLRASHPNQGNHGSHRANAQNYPPAVDVCLPPTFQTRIQRGEGAGAGIPTFLHFSGLRWWWRNNISHMFVFVAKLLLVKSLPMANEARPSLEAFGREP